MSSKKNTQESIFKKPQSKGGIKLPPMEMGSGQVGSANEEYGEEGKDTLKAKKNITGNQNAPGWEMESSENANLKSFEPKRSNLGSINLHSKSGELKVPGLDDDNKSKSGRIRQLGSVGKENILNGSFSASVQSVKQFESVAKKRKRVMLAVHAVVKFWRILDHIKQYGTSSNLYNIAFRSRKSVKKSIFPIAKNSTQVKAKVTLKFLFHPNSIYLSVWNMFLFMFVIYAMSLMPYLAVFVDETNPWQSAFEDMMDVVFMADVVLNFFTAIMNSKQE